MLPAPLRVSVETVGSGSDRREPDGMRTHLSQVLLFCTARGQRPSLRNLVEVLQVGLAHPHPKLVTPGDASGADVGGSSLPGKKLVG